MSSSELKATFGSGRGCGRPARNGQDCIADNRSFSVIKQHPRIVRRGETRRRVGAGDAGRRGWATSHGRERVRDGVENRPAVAPRRLAGGRWTYWEQPGRAAGPGRAVDGHREKAGPGLHDLIIRHLRHCTERADRAAWAKVMRVAKVAPSALGLGGCDCRATWAILDPSSRIGSR